MHDKLINPIVMYIPTQVDILQCEGNDNGIIVMMNITQYTNSCHM